MEWLREGKAVPLGEAGSPDSHSVFRPWVLEETDGALTMWYAGNDGATWRVLRAARQRGSGWERQGVAVGAGFAGETDAYGVEAPCVVRTPGGYLMAYAGFDGDVTRLHMASSADGRRWEPLGAFLQRGDDDCLAATHPCLVVMPEQWWLFFSGYDGSSDSRHAVVLGATSASGASWDRFGAVLEPEPGEVAVTHPCVVDISGTYYMFYASDDGEQTRVGVASSVDALGWNRRGITLSPSKDAGERSVTAPCVVRLRDGSLRLWYAALGSGPAGPGWEIFSARFPGGWHG